MCVSPSRSSIKPFLFLAIIRIWAFHTSWRYHLIDSGIDCIDLGLVLLIHLGDDVIWKVCIQWDNYKLTLTGWLFLWSLCFICKNNPMKIRHSIQFASLGWIYFINLILSRFFMKYHDTYLLKDDKYNKYLRTVVQYYTWLVEGGLWAPFYLFPARLLV